jgi:fluoride ion exporter CrcB/FEX
MDGYKMNSILLIGGTGFIGSVERFLLSTIKIEKTTSFFESTFLVTV